MKDQPKPFPRIVIIVLLVVVALVLLSIAVIQTIRQPPPQPTMSGLQIAEQSTQFLDSMRLPDGTYFLQKQCDGTRSESIPQSNAWALLAYSGLYQATVDEKYRTAADRELFAIDAAAQDPEKYAALIMATIQLEAGRKVFGEPQGRLDYVIGMGNTLALVQDPSGLESPMIISIGARELAMTYALLNSGQYTKITDAERGKLVRDTLAKSREYYQAAKKLQRQEQPWFGQGGVDFKGSACWLSLAELQMHQATGEEIYLSSAKQLFNAIDFGKAIADNPTVELIPSVVEPCVESLLLLYRETKNEAYLRSAVELMQCLIQSKWDSNYNSRCSPDNGYVISAANTIKFHTDTAYQIYLLAQPELKDIKFAVVKP